MRYLLKENEMYLKTISLKEALKKLGKEPKIGIWDNFSIYEEDEMEDRILTNGETLINQMKEVNLQLSNLINDLGDQLQSIMVEATPEVEPKEEPVRELPPLFRLAQEEHQETMTKLNVLRSFITRIQL